MEAGLKRQCECFELCESFRGLQTTRIFTAVFTLLNCYNVFQCWQQLLLSLQFEFLALLSGGCPGAGSPKVSTSSEGRIDSDPV